MNWNDYFLGLAHSVASKSKDPSSKVGAVIVAPDKTVVSVGFNGPPRGTDDGYCYSHREIKLVRTLHAECNAILFAGKSLVGCTLFCTHHPCARCAAMIVQVGIRSVVHPPVNVEFEKRWHDDMIEARAMFAEAGVTRLVIDQ